MPPAEAMLAEINRLRERLLMLESENASLSAKLNRQQWEVENRLAEIEMQICGAGSPMSTNSMPIDRLQALDNVEKEIASCILSAGQALQELSKDKPSMKQVEGHTTQFVKTLGRVEAELSQHINYLTQVSTGQAHEGSSYGSLKMHKLACHRLDHTRKKLQELESLRNRAIAAATRPTSVQNNP
uniref:Mediator of RNA polymerase II transcription subunit 11 n=1 Tax=Moina brachiata TaxID=675436 RepID=A0A4Y7NJS8_9CRUS|nr:EOG090X0LXA [Moina brachiata]SVE93412.1 EOG090X0LXA [Moina brachiata]